MTLNFELSWTNPKLILTPECAVPVPGIPVPGNSTIFLMVSEPVSKKFGTEKSPGTGLGKFWYQKKVSESVSFIFWVSSHTGGENVFDILGVGPLHGGLTPQVTIQCGHQNRTEQLCHFNSSFQQYQSSSILNPRIKDTRSSDT